MTAKVSMRERVAGPSWIAKPDAKTKQTISRVKAVDKQVVRFSMNGFDDTSERGPCNGAQVQPLADRSKARDH
jgi:hypothetical protein